MSHCDCTSCRDPATPRSACCACAYGTDTGDCASLEAIVSVFFASLRLVAQAALLVAQLHLVVAMYHRRHHGDHGGANAGDQQVVVGLRRTTGTPAQDVDGGAVIGSPCR